MHTRRSLLRLAPLQADYTPSTEALRLFMNARDRLGVSNAYVQTHETLPVDEDLVGREIGCPRCGGRVAFLSLWQPSTHGGLLAALYAQLLEEAAHPTFTLPCCGGVISGLELLEQLPAKPVSFAVLVPRDPDEGVLPSRVIVELERILQCDLRPSWTLEESNA